MQPPIPILMYHSIASMPKGTVMRSLHVPPKRFYFQMRILKWLGYRGVSMGELMPYLTGEREGKVVGITFDDGYRNNLIEALPILKQFGFSATCYIISQMTGGVNEWDLEKGIPENPLMNKNEIRHWIDSGMEIGSHTQHHVRLTECEETEAKTEIFQSKVDLEEQFGKAVEHFCYPWGDLDPTIQKVAESAGFHTATTTQRGRATLRQHPLLLPRVPVTHHTLPHLFLMKILTHYEDNHA
ncbi:MAG: polysaccharide deacetylase family protein [Gammaproteobacteria bacterium]|jgi:peptidoglycan/xylan/chitin deacetylase (PgdA/CDA1 family)|nr:polysaccharide deacetylase family protein [Gammaproteobacteria bacterium]MBT3951482.1 polysaccharide deacetylase family protein [Candidatus Neomarinimicrobiota bacterium]MBT4328756.1 polysaccharide deacetylase family protein [Gammaproteobacteria bacterium]MBT6878015.1 polysaccharide deacetylase family protein [Gammaproteobacteria bacterium]